MLSCRSEPAGKLMLAAAVLACVLASLPSADAHASLQTPVSRNVAYFTTAGSFPGQNLGAWYANGGNGLGPQPFRPAGNPGVCGDPYQESPFTNVANFAGPVTTYTSGQNIRVTVRLQVNHGGRITFRLCDRKTNLDQACFNGRTLNRVDTGRPHFYILSGSWANTNAGNPEFANIDYKLPDGFSCPNGCVLQMEYFTYNTCVEQCPRADCSWYADRMNYIIPAGQQGPKSICYTAGAGTPEIFRNCADIVITGGSGTGGTGGGGVCGKCNLPAYLGGCKCDGNCNCLPGTGGSVCDKCNIPVASGGCKCNSNCACLTTGTTCSSVTSPGGSCGNGVCCPSGQCCSQYGWCGTTSAHCGAGCQSRFGACSATGASLTAPKRARKSRFGVYDASNTTLVQAEAGAGITADAPVAVTSTIDPAAASVVAAVPVPTPVDPTATAGPAAVDLSTAAAASATDPAATAPADVAAAAVGVVDPAAAVGVVDPAVAAPAPDAAVAAAAPEAGK